MILNLYIEHMLTKVERTNFPFLLCLLPLSKVQTRSADEPMTTFVVCNECGNRWKVRLFDCSVYLTADNQALCLISCFTINDSWVSVDCYFLTQKWYCTLIFWNGFLIWSYLWPKVLRMHKFWLRVKVRTLT